MDRIPKFKPKWKNQPTKAIRVPKAFSERLIKIAKKLDNDEPVKSVVGQFNNVRDNPGKIDLESLSHDDLIRLAAESVERLQEPEKFRGRVIPSNRIELVGNLVKVYFKFDPALLAKAQSIDLRSFNGEEKCNEYPLDKLQNVLDTFSDFYVSPVIIEILERREKLQEEREQLTSKLKEEYQNRVADLVNDLALSQQLKNNWTLFDHQKSGIKWLLERVRVNGYNGAILADHMGLGKTITALEAARKLQQIEKADIIVICPASLKSVWNGAAKELGIRVFIFSWAKIPQIEEGKKYILICDEAHYAQNLKSARTKKMLNLAISPNCLATWLLTGTPIKNGRPINLFPLLQACDHEFSRDFKRYELYFCDAQYSGFGWNNKGASHLRELREGIAHILLRRTKKECLDLPGKIRSLVPLDIDKSSEATYKEKIEELRGNQRQRVEEGLIKSGNSLLGDLAMLRHAGSTAKIKSAIKFCESIIEQGSKVVVFTEFVDTAKSLAKSLNGCLLIGDTPEGNRQKIVEDFQAGYFPAFVGTVKTGGVGLTLTTANYVVLVDRPWTPGDAEQAEDRCYRIGQNLTVQSYWLQLPFGLDKKIDALLNSKQKNIDRVLSGKVQEDLTASEIKQIAIDYLNSSKP